ncbi:hypothetical protein DSO57_1026559 [Entomophthora muscae]|uniref:Uncharacterized protein n=1 Tax=Entomophthora muscae TaxID=34485 RepID=A0ACC2TE68_9FUNG|nr:hypothetical protein DSO57_1026559 [Entomophthora muscae]
MMLHLLLIIKSIAAENNRGLDSLHQMNLDPAQVQEFCSNIDSHPDPCYLAKNICSSSEDLINFKSLYYCELQRSFPLMLLIAILLLLALFYLLYYCSEYYLSIPLQRLVLAVEMDSQIAGVTLLAFANGAPDLFTTLAGSDSREGPPGSGIPLIIGNILGGGMFTACLAMAISILVSRPNTVNPDDIFFGTDELPYPSKKNLDRSWIVLPRGFFVNLGVYFSGFILLAILCVTLDLSFAYPPTQFSIYLIYIVYTIYPRFQPQIHSILYNSWPSAVFKSSLLPLFSLDSPSITLTAPDTNNANPTSNNSTYIQRHPVPTNHDLSRPTSAQSSPSMESPLERTVGSPGQSELRHQGTPDSYLLPSSVPLISKPSPAMLSAEIQPMAENRSTSCQTTKADSDVSQMLVRYGFQDASGSWGLFRLFSLKFNRPLEKKLSWGLFEHAATILTFPIVAPFFFSVTPSLGTWTLIDRGTDAWDEVDFACDLEDGSALAPNSAQASPTILTSRALILRQLVAMPKEGVSNFRRFQALTLVLFGVLSAVSLGYGLRPISLGIPGFAVGLLVGAVAGGLIYWLSCTLPSTAEHYRELLAKHLESLDAKAVPSFNPNYLPQDVTIFQHTDTLKDTLSSEFIEAGSGFNYQPKIPRICVADEAGPSHQHPGFIPNSHPSWPTTFNALTRRGSYSSAMRKSSSMYSLSPNQKLRGFLSKTNPDLKPLDYVFRLDCCILVISIVMAILYIKTLSSLLVGLLQVLADILRLPPALVGMTVLAWGNSISDLISAVAMAKGGYSMIALTSTLAGPVLNLLLIFGVTLCDTLVRNGPIKLPRVPPVTWVAMGSLFINCLMILILVLPTKKGLGQIRRPGLSVLPYVQIGIFIMFLIAVAVVQLIV